jgi:hypothetical protein
MNPETSQKFYPRMARLQNKLRILAYGQFSTSADWQSLTTAFVHMINGNYLQDIRLLRAGLTYMLSPDWTPGTGGISMVQMPSDFFTYAEILVFAMRHEDAKNDRGIIYRVQARGYFEIGLLKEKLGLKSEAMASLTRGSEIFEKTTLHKDNEVQKSEQRETLLALARLSSTARDVSQQSTDTEASANEPENNIVAVLAFC